MSVHISENFADLLNPLFIEIATGAYDKGKSRIPDLFAVKDSKLSEEKYSEVTPLKKLGRFTGAIEYMNIVQGYDVTSTPQEYAGGLQIKRTLYDDDQHDIIPQLFDQFGASAFKAHEDDAAGLFNGGFSASSDFYSHTEGVALFSSSHTCPDSTIATTTGFSNYGTSALTATSLAAARLQMKGVKDNSGDKIGLLMNELWVPDDLEQKASEILQTEKGYDEATGTINFMNGKFSLKTWNRISSTKNWFLFNAEERKKNLIWFWRVKFETGKMEQFDNFTAKARAYMRYAWLWRNWRFGFGSNVT